MSIFVFDLDGTLLDTIPGINKALNITLAHFNSPYSYNIKEATSFIGKGSLYMLQQAFKRSDIDEEIIKFYYARYIETQVVSVLYKNVYKTLKELKKSGNHIGIYSNKPDIALQALIKDKLSDVEFDFVIGQLEGALPKPNADVLKDRLKELGLENEKGYYVGDSYIDILTARNLNYKSVILSSGYGKIEDIKANNPDYLFDDIIKVASIEEK